MEQTQKGKGEGFLENIFNVLGGGFLVSDTFRKQYKYMLLLVFLFMIYVANTYKFESTYRSINEEHRELVKAKYKAVMIKSELLDSIRPSQLLDKYKGIGFGFNSKEVFVIE